MARLSLAMVVGEQVSLDQGSWQLAWQFSFEEEPPHQNFTRGGADSRSLPVPQTADPRWTEVAISRLRDLDSLLEIRKRLAKSSADVLPHQLTKDGLEKATPRPPRKRNNEKAGEEKAATRKAPPPKQN